MIAASVLHTALVELLGEAYAGPADPSATWFIDNQAGAGLLGTLEGVSATAASILFGDTAAEGATIAAQVEHLRWSLALANASTRGETADTDWSHSWAVQAVTGEEWDTLCAALRYEFETVRDTLPTPTQFGDEGKWTAEFITGSIALIAHAAYHLGVIRLMVRLLPA